jgi:nicotinamidase/pyrazinamidase
LVVIDVQRDFCEGGSLAIEGGAAVAERISRLLVDHAYDVVVAARDWHVEPGVHWADEPDWVESFPVHCAAGTEGAELHPALWTHVDFDAVADRVFAKGRYTPSFSGFEGVDDDGVLTGDWLRGRAVDELDVVGLAYSGCVKATVQSAVAEGFTVRVLTDCCADPPGYGHEEQTAADLHAIGVTVTTSDLPVLERLASPPLGQPPLARPGGPTP